jgi:hypothetical protein
MGAFFGLEATCLIGVSCGFPLFLYMRERKLAGDKRHDGSQKI